RRIDEGEGRAGDLEHTRARVAVRTTAARDCRRQRGARHGGRPAAKPSRLARSYASGVAARMAMVKPGHGIDHSSGGAAEVMVKSTHQAVLALDRAPRHAKDLPREVGDAVRYPLTPHCARGLAH